MKIEDGGYRRGLVFKNVVVKISKCFILKLNMQTYKQYKRFSLLYFIEGLLSNINEIYNWYRYKALRKYMCPIYFHDFLGLFLVMKRVDLYTDIEVPKPLKDSFINEINQYKNHPVFSDLKFDNIGLLDNRLVLIDFGDCNNIKNHLKKIRNK